MPYKIMDAKLPPDSMENVIGILPLPAVTLNRASPGPGALDGELAWPPARGAVD
jgi:hypothetical protein